MDCPPGKKCYTVEGDAKGVERYIGDDGEEEITGDTDGDIQTTSTTASAPTTNPGTVFNPLPNQRPPGQLTRRSTNFTDNTK